MNDLLADIGMWAGTKESLAAYVQTVTSLTPELLASKQADYGQDSERAPRLYKRMGDIGVITVAGPLNNSSSWINEYIGATGYPEIRNALVYAAKDEGAKRILLDVKSGGGAVSGVSDTSDLVKRIDQGVKPVFAFSDGMMASAAYWLGSSARRIEVGKVAEIGSIGVLLVHQAYAKMLEKAGITATVMRAGKYKALGNPYEELTDEAKAEIQDSLDQMYQLFGEHVAEARGVSYADFDRRMGQGRVFIGAAAVDVGLADAVSNFDKVMGAIQNGIDSEKSSPKYGANLVKEHPVKKSLTEQEIAAIAAGAAAPAEEQGEPQAEETKPEGEQEQSGAEANEGEGAGEAEAGAAAGAEDSKSETVSAIDLLKAQLNEANEKVLSLQIDLHGANARADKAEAAASKFRPIVEAALGNMRVAMQGSRNGIEAMSNETLVESFDAAAADFKAKFKAGGVAAVKPETSQSKKQEGDGASKGAFSKARLNATRLT